MLLPATRHNHFVELLTASAWLDRELPAGLTNARTIEFMLDIMPLRYRAGVIAGVAFAGDQFACGWFEYDSPGVSANLNALVRFGTIRGVDKYSGNGTLVLGKRTVLYGKDDTVNVTAWQDGNALGSQTGQTNWTTAQAATAFAVIPNLLIGKESINSATMGLRLYEAWVKINGILIAHYLPTDHDGATIPDRTPFGNDISVTGTESTDYRYAPAWGRGGP